MKAIESEEAETCGAPPPREYDEHGGELNPTPERLAEIEAAWMKEVRQDLKDYQEGRLQGIPWEQARIGLFDPPTPEELAEYAAEAQSRRARR